MNSNIQKRIKEWSKDPFCHETILKVSKLKKDPELLHDSFYKELEFGTGGMRGISGVGTNRINKYTIAPSSNDCSLIGAIANDNNKFPSFTYDINEGTISIDTYPIAKVSKSDLRRHIAYVPQEPVIFSKSVEDNISIGRVNASFAEVERAAQLACAEEFIKDLPHGYNTLLGERGLLISVGQKQRIAIARAILRDSPILLLDEATSSLDAISEDAIKTAIDNISGNKTIIVIAHRLSTVRNADSCLLYTSPSPRDS